MVEITARRAVKLVNGLTKTSPKDSQVGQCNISAEDRKTVSIALALVAVAPAVKLT
jgi:hypothetical protein